MLCFKIKDLLFKNNNNSFVQSIPYFELLEEVGIFHKTPESAAKKVNDVWNDIDKWWNGKLIQTARVKFCNAYARTPSNPLKLLKNMILDV